MPLDFLWKLLHEFLNLENLLSIIILVEYILPLHFNHIDSACMHTYC
jgi:hypothetical protein